MPASRGQFRKATSFYKKLGSDGTLNTSVEILWEDKDILVCRKPAGIPVQTAKPGQPDMESLLKNDRAGKGEPPEIYVVHRLDQPVEGLMVFAKNKRSAAALNRQIQQKQADKCYWALVEGLVEPTEGRLVDDLLRDGRTNTSRVVKEGAVGAKRAVLDYKVLETGNRTAVGNREKPGQEIETERGKTPEISLVEIRLETGRHHQIRVQMMHRGHPLVGDKKYNPACQTGYLPIALCSVRLAFAHPVTGKWMAFQIEPEGEAFRNFL